jgi:hypothetical protein
MDSIRVLINDTEVGYYKIEDTGVSFTWQAKLIDEINSFSTTTTKTITLPLTKTLDTILKSPTVIDTTNSVSNREYFTINITWNGIVTVEGYIKLQRVVILENDEYIEFSIEPKEKDWVTQFKDFKLTELDFTLGTSQQHTLTYANIITSETPLLATREYVYAPIDIAEVGRLQVLWVEQSGSPTITYFYYFGEVVSSTNFRANTYGFNESNLTQYDIVLTTVADAFWNARGIYKASANTIIPIETFGEHGYIYPVNKSPFYWEVSDFYPLVRHQAIVKRCFNRIGYGVTIVDNSDYFNNKYNFLHNIKIINNAAENRDKFKARVQPSGFSYSKSTNHDWRVPFRNLGTTELISSAKWTDTNSNNSANIDAGTNVAKYTVTETCILGFEWDYHTVYTMTNPFTFPIAYDIIEIRMFQFDSGGTLRRTAEFKCKSDTTMTSLTWTFSGTMKAVFYMEVGDFIECSIGANIAAGQAPVTVLISDINTLKTIYYAGGNYKNKTIRLNEYLPDVPAYDYIKDLSFINNWEFYTNEKLKQVYIVREDYKRTGKQIDFKNKLNISNGVELEEIGLQWPKKSYFNWKQDENDWCIKFIEQVTRASLGNTYEQSELDMACRFGVGVITNLNLFTADVQEFTNNIYSATLDKFDTSNRINFNTVEMKGEETWPHLPTWKRIDYEPRYLTVYFGQTVETNGVNEVTGVVYSIEGNANHTTYPRVEFGEPLHYGDATGLLKTKYARRERAIKYGWIFRGKFNVDNIDVTEFVETYEDNNFRANYQLQLKGVSVIGELLKVADFSPNTSDQTEIEFVIYRDDL